MYIFFSLHNFQCNKNYWMFNFFLPENNGFLSSTLIHAFIDIDIRVLHFSSLVCIPRVRERYERITNETRAAKGGRGGGGRRKLTRRKRTSAKEKENTLVKYKGYSRFCNRVISRNPLFQACYANMCSSPCTTKTRIDSSILTFHPLRESLFHLLPVIACLLYLLYWLVAREMDDFMND